MIFCCVAEGCAALTACGLRYSLGLVTMGFAIGIALMNIHMG